MARLTSFASLVSRAFAPGRLDAAAYAIVVLGCVVRPDPAHPSRLAAGPARRRTEAAARAFQEASAAGGEGPLVVCTGGKVWEAGVEADALKRALVSLGVPEGNVARELVSFTTRENARYTAALCARRGIGKVVLVSCVWHLERAARLFEAAGLEVVGCVSAGDAERGAFARAWWRGRERLLWALGQ